MSFTLRNASLIAVALSGLLFGCATSQKIQVVQPGDQNLSCNAIKEELARLDKAQADIDSKKGVTGTDNAKLNRFAIRRWRTFLVAGFGVYLLRCWRSYSFSR